MLKRILNSTVAVAVVAASTFTTLAAEPENVATISSKLDSIELSHRLDGMGDLTVAHEGLVGCLPALVRMAHKDEVKWRVEALEKIGEFAHHARGAGPQLVDLLEHAVADVRIAAADAILGIEDKSEPAVASLIAALRAEGALSRIRAADALAKHARVTKNAIPGLLRALQDPEMDVRAAAAEALGEIAAPANSEVIAALGKLLADPEPWVRGKAAAALWNLDEPAASIMPTLIKLVAEYRVNPDRDVTQDIWGRDAGIELLAKIGPEAEAAVPALIAALDSTQTGERMAAADALAAIGPAAAPAIERLSKLLRDTEGHTFIFAHRAWFVSDHAADALGKIGPVARPTLLAALTDKHERVRNLAAKQLGALPPDDETITALRRLLDDKDLPVRASAAFHLGKMGTKALVAVPQIVPLLNDNGEWVSFPGGGIGSDYTLAEHARVALQNLKPIPADVLPTIIAMLRKDQRLEPTLRDYLRELGLAAKDVAPLLEPLLKDANQRNSAALALAHVAPDHPGLLELLEDDFSRTNDVEFFSNGLGALGTKAQSALPTLQRVLKAEAHFPDTRAIIASAMLKIDPTDSQAIRALAEALQNLDPGSPDIPEARETWSKLGRKGAVAEEKLLEGMYSVQTEPADNAYLRNMFEKQRRLRSAQMLNLVGTKQSAVIEALISLCGCDHCDVRGEAADTLGSLGAAAAVAAPVLAEMLDDEEQYIVNGDFYGNGGEKHLPGDHARDALARMGVPALPALRSALKSESRTIRRRAAEAIGLIGPSAQAAEDELIRAAKDAHREVRAAADRGLGQIGAARPACINALISAIADKHLVVRIRAAHALGNFGPRSVTAIPALEELQRDPLVPAQQAARAAIARIQSVKP